MSNVRLLTRTTGIEGTEYDRKSICEQIVGIARISSSREINELFIEPEKLLRHCILNGHWSIFTMANLTFEIVTSRAIGREFIRHWSLASTEISIQEYSQRYSPVVEFEPIELRKQSQNNRQASDEIFKEQIKVKVYNDHFGNYSSYSDDPNSIVDDLLTDIKSTYNNLLDNGVSRETARFILPETAQTTLVLNGKIRDWITTLSQRLHKSTVQKEARLIAEQIRDIFIKECPIISEALHNFQDSDQIHIMDRLVLEKFGCFQLVKENGFKKLK